MNAKWRLELFGRLRASLGPDLAIDRFRTRKAGALLAYLALNSHRTHAREELIDIFWPDSDLDGGRNSLKQELAALRRQLEPAGIFPSGSVICADRVCVRLNPKTIDTDVHEFEQGLREAARCDGAADRKAELTRAIACYGGDLLPGAYEDWIVAERARLQSLYAGALQSLSAVQEEAGDLAMAIDSAYNAIRLDSWDTGAHERLLRLLSSAGQHDAVVRQFAEMERLLKQVGDLPSEAAVRLAGEARSALDALQTVPALSPAPADCPPENPKPSTDLPLSFTRFFGRSVELRRLESLLNDPHVRLVTLSGAPGAGKTRLCVEFGRLIASAGSRPAAFIPLAGLPNGGHLLSTLCDRLACDTRGKSFIQALEERLAGEPFLFLLDNFEQIVDTGASVVRELIEALPNVKVIATSRVRLHIAGEREFPVLPLPIPDSQEGMAAYAAVQLFVDRARAARPDFQLTRANSGAISRLCARLDGVPLAIELVASWAGSLTPTQMLQRLESRSDILRSRARDIEPRHKTLWNAIDWSVQMLSAPARSVLPALAVFRSGFTLDALAYVIGQEDVLDAVSELVDHNLIVRIHCETIDTMRYRPYESLREYAASVTQPNAATRFALAHARFFAEQARESSRHEFSPRQPEWLDRLEWDLDNLRAALEWLAETDTTLGLEIMAGTWQYWQMRGCFAEARTWIDRMLSSGNLPGALRAQGLLAAAHLATAECEYELGAALGRQGLDLCREIGDRSGQISGLAAMGEAAAHTGRSAESVELFLEAVELARACGDRPGLAAALRGLGLVKFNVSEFEASRQCFEETLGIWRGLGYERGIAASLNGLATLISIIGSQTPEAMNRNGVVVPEGWKASESVKSLYQEAISIYRRLDERPGLAKALYNLGDIAWAEGSYQEARHYFGQAAPIFLRAGMLVYLAHALEGCVAVEIRSGSPYRAAVLMSVAGALRDRIGAPMPPSGQDCYNETCAMVRENLAAEQLQQAWSEGRVFTLEQAVQFAVGK